MKEVSREIEYNGVTYSLVFNLNVMQVIQGEYETLGKWGDLTDGKARDGEPDIKALIFGVTEMLNEGIDIKNEKNGTQEPYFTHKQVGRILTDIGVRELTETVNDVVIESAGNDEKNA